MPKPFGIILLGILLLCLLKPILSEDPKLIYIQQVFRHGHRYPLNPYTYDNSTFIRSINSPGELTNLGKSMHYILGQRLYQEYWNKLFANTPFFATYNQSKFYAKSTDVNRTIQSAQSQLLGIFQNLEYLTLSNRDIPFSLPQWPGVTRTSGNVYVKTPTFNPVPIHVEKGYPNPWDKGDFLRIYSGEFCPNQNVWQAQNLKRPQVKQIMNDPTFQAAIRAVNTLYKTNFTFQAIFRVYDNAICMHYQGREVDPLWTTPSPTKDALDAIFPIDMYLKLFYTEKQLATTATGYFNETYYHFKRVQADQSGVQWSFYSGHDTTMGNFLARMNLTNAKCIYQNYKRGINKDKQSPTCIVEYPNFSSNLIFELYQYNNKTTILKVRYNGEYRRIPFCDWQDSCPVERFYQWFQSWQDKDYVSSCGIKSSTPSNTAYSMAVLQSGVIFCFIIAFLYIHMGKKNFKQDGNLWSQIGKESVINADSAGSQRREQLSNSVITKQ